MIKIQGNAVNMNNKYLKQECFLTTEVLPSELPNFFSNHPIKSNLEELINLIPTDSKNFNKKFNDKHTIPLNFEIPKNIGGLRTISLMHPSAQLKFMFYIMKYEYLLINFLQKSKFNVRKVQKTNTITHNESKALDKERLKIEQDFGITGDSSITNEELDRLFKKYFTYNKHHKLSGIIKSPSFHRDSLKYRFFSKLDIQNFFGSIYTHSITWAIVGDKHVGKGYSSQHLKNTFAAQSDIIQQKSNDNETNGIIIGPEINRIIADIILTHCDYIIEKNLNQQGINFNKDYKIYRYVDDYYIFSKTYEHLEIIEKEISKELLNFNLKLNLEKHQIKEQPFSLSDTPIVQLKQTLNIFSNNREINLLKLSKNNNLYCRGDGLSYEISVNQILLKESAWIQLYEVIRNIIISSPSSKKRIVLYFLKYISLEIYIPSFIKRGGNSYFFRNLRTIYTALDQITNIYSIHPDSDTTEAYINTIMKFRASLSNLKSIITNSGEEFIENSVNYISDMENRIFENIYRILKNNSDRINNISDLIVYLKFFEQKISTQFLCQLLEKNQEDYFTLCAVGYYIIEDVRRYRVVLDHLYKSVSSFVKNYQTHTNSHLEDAKYFYILNDFIYYPEFQTLEIKNKSAKDILQEFKDKELDKLGRDSTYYKIFKQLMNQSYYNWDLKQIDFEKLQIQKIITDKNNLSFDDY
ncbi:RNA-directed DNA polymerase [Streptococcus suis]|uniref:RNA-directed DNA polymerase n=1 Tax=Streptococcus suis TaxID=1307 RepID=A0A4T2H9B9_STRSU|nr:RNA-directed DNA polymerase [Streptococcus suis]MBM7284413.1 RNA-directed DNA polymerase [Streptococcus suis]MBO3643266.1 RNA-directed DNA polymerase [Streptococcus suis]MCO8237116.1 RNA-directed DNA polymerase [Streptococcus suis]TII07847.1 RNA-directed DNA polymerase [Streptococcus suis]HEM3532991.1 RNA-directed DNA polymerase [Streptococcus suis]